MLAVPMNECPMQSKWCWLCLKSKWSVSHSHPMENYNPRKWRGHENSNALIICRNRPSSGFLEAMGLAEVQANHTWSSRGSQVNMWMKPNYSRRKWNSGQGRKSLGIISSLFSFESPNKNNS